MRRRVLFGLTFLPLAGLITACGAAGVESNGETSTVTLASSITGSSFLAVTAGLDQGIFEKHGVDLDVVNVKTTAEGTAALSSSDADIVAMLTPGAIAARASGADVKIVGGLMTQDQDILYADPTVHSLGDLAGKKVGVVGPGSATEMLAKALVSEQGVNPSDVEFVPSGAPAAQLSAMISGQLDAAALISHQGVTAEAEGMVRLANYRDHYPDLTPQVFVADAAVIEQSRNSFENFIDAYSESAQWATDHPDESVKLLAADARIDEPEAAEAYDFAKSDFAKGAEVSKAGLSAWVEMYKDFGPAAKDLPTVEELYDESLTTVD